MKFEREKTNHFTNWMANHPNATVREAYSAGWDAVISYAQKIIDAQQEEIDRLHAMKAAPQS